MDLLNENIGHNVRGRVEISDDEDDRERIKGQLFGTVSLTYPLFFKTFSSLILSMMAVQTNKNTSNEYIRTLGQEVNLNNLVYFCLLIYMIYSFRRPVYCAR